ncbi:MAG: class I SAM-dependent methyltransferase [Pseudomonadota bacterium]
MENATTFGMQADVYASARPTYPDTLFDWIVAQAPSHDQAWDVGTGSGQAAQQLAGHFKHVHATDLDSAQIAQARQHPCITFQVAPCDASGLSDNSADAITVATALHWFDHGAFWPEVERVGRPGAIFCGWTYGGGQAEPDVQAVLFDPIKEVLRPYWSEGNRLSWRGYTKDALNMPFDVIDMPAFACELNWRPRQIAAFIRSWSAHQKARLDGHAETLAALEQEALATLGDNSTRYVLPLKTIAGRV